MAYSGFGHGHAEGAELWSSEAMEVLVGVLGRGMLLLAGACCLVPGLLLSLGTLQRLGRACLALSSPRSHDGFLTWAGGPDQVPGRGER